MTEVAALQKLNHPNIVNILDFEEEGVLNKKSGASYKVSCIVVEELAEGGESFFYVANSGFFDESVARYFFKQFVDGLQYIHTHGHSHRDIKPDNILFDGEFNIKIADFGYAGPISGRDGKGYLKTICGTKPYMAPELLAGKAYQGSQVDVFAGAIVLFILAAGTPPFMQGSAEDQYYRLIIGGRWDMFWKLHYRGKAAGDKHFSEDFKNLIQAMFSQDPNTRPTLDEIRAHPWFNGPTPSKSEIQAEFEERKRINDEKAEEARVEK